MIFFEHITHIRQDIPRKKRESRPCRVRAFGSSEFARVSKPRIIQKAILSMFLGNIVGMRICCVLIVLLSVSGCALPTMPGPFVGEPVVDVDPEVSQLAECALLLTYDFEFRQEPPSSATAKVYKSPDFMRKYNPNTGIYEDYLALAVATVMATRGVNEAAAMEILLKTVEREHGRFMKKIQYITSLRGSDRLGALNRIMDPRLEICDNLYYKTVSRKLSKTGE